MSRKILIYMSEKKVHTYVIKDSVIKKINVNGEVEFVWSNKLEFELYANGVLKSLPKSSFYNEIICIFYDSVSIKDIAKFIECVDTAEDLQIVSVKNFLESYSNYFFNKTNKKSIVVRLLDDNYYIEGYTNEVVNISKTNSNAEVDINVPEILFGNVQSNIQNNRSSKENTVKEKESCLYAKELLYNLYRQNLDDYDVKSIREDICTLLKVKNDEKCDFKILMYYNIAHILKLGSSEMYCKTKKEIIDYGNQVISNEPLYKAYRREFAKIDTFSQLISKEINGEKGNCYPVVINCIFVDELHNKNILSGMKNEILRNDYANVIERYRKKGGK